MKLLYAIQIMSLMTALMLGMLLLLCPYRGTGFKKYNQTRWMLTGSIFIIAIQYALQMMFSIRAQNESLGTTCNLFFYVPGNILFLLGALNLQQQNSLKKKEICIGGAMSAIVIMCLTIGLFYKQGIYIRETNHICGVFYLCIQLYYSSQIYIGYKKMVRNIDEYYGSPVEEYIHWMRNASILLFVCLLFVPFAIFSTKALLFFGFLFWITFSYYVFNFSYFGHYAEIVEETQTEDEKTPDSTATPNFSNIAEWTLAPLVNKWIQEKKYHDSDITIVKLASEIGTNRTTLSRYINTNIGKSFREWINGLRIEDAKQMMRENPNKGIEDIAISCGFSTRKYFDQVFCNYEQVTAAEWRKRQ